MEILDTTVANVALRYMAGGLAAPVADSEWIITSYLAANAIVLPITGWLAAHLGRRNYFLLSIAIFTLSSALCGMATSLWQMILFRVIQGLSGGGLQPCSQGVLLDSFPPEKQGTAMTLFGLAAIIAPIVGPTLGGWLCVNYNWRWIFLINVPIGLLALVASYVCVEDPDYLKHQRAELRRQPLNFDYIGLGVLALVMSCWEIVLSKGQEWDWLGDPFGRVQVLMILFVVGLGFLIAWEMRSKHPIINFRVLGERNLAMACIILFCAFAVVYGASIALPGMLQTLFGYDALRAGLVMSPSGASSMAAMVLVGVLLGRQFDARWMIAAGLVAMAAGSYWMARMNIQISPSQVVWPRMLLTLGL
ncbi:MAG TPA: DHA2 family efflux MFS transporter permease subunit, partial [Candidatus Anammoximicrobium sp.]|nr:DHA2 family efflux MFS transporter permease subunit [Candidatus Anammoximicrobium sp.]